MLVLLHVAALAAFVVALDTGNRNALLATALLIACLFAHWSDFVVLRSVRNVAERAVYFSWLSSNTQYREMFVGSCVACLFVGLLQAALTAWLGDLDQVVLFLGAYYPAIIEGQYWRVLSGPFIHSGALHWMQNSFALILLMPVLAVSIGGIHAAGIFLLGNTAGLLFVLQTTARHDYYAGMSAGVHALAGALLVMLVARRNRFPRGMWQVLLSLLVVDYIVAMMSSNTSIRAHFAGGMVGIAIGSLLVMLTEKSAQSPFENPRQRRVLQLAGNLRRRMPHSS